jgi:hypothetical protein
LRPHRVLLHNHSTWSNGQLSLKEVARVGEQFGVSAIAMSEHDFDFTPQKWEEYREACRFESTKSCLLIPGIEYSSPDDDIHVVTVGAVSYFGARRDLVETLAAVRAEGGATILAHPRRRDSFYKITPELLQQIDAIEIWNRKVDGLAGPLVFYIRKKSQFGDYGGHGLAHAASDISNVEHSRCRSRARRWQSHRYRVANPHDCARLFHRATQSCP